MSYVSAPKSNIIFSDVALVGQIYLLQIVTIGSDTKFPALTVIPLKDSCASVCTDFAIACITQKEPDP